MCEKQLKEITLKQYRPCSLDHVWICKNHRDLVHQAHTRFELHMRGDVQQNNKLRGAHTYLELCPGCLFLSNNFSPRALNKTSNCTRPAFISRRFMRYLSSVMPAVNSDGQLMMHKALLHIITVVYYYIELWSIWLTVTLPGNEPSNPHNFVVTIIMR